MEERRLKAQAILKSSFLRATEEIPGFEAEPVSGLALFDVPGALLDSLNLISFVFIIEDEFERITGKKTKITTEDVLKSTETPFQTTDTLEAFLARRIG